MTIKEVDLRYALQHLAEALETIGQIQFSLACEQAPSDEYIAQHLAHVYAHLNWFWNGRNRADRTAVTLSDEEFLTFSAFPSDIEVRYGHDFGLVGHSQDEEDRGRRESP